MNLMTLVTLTKHKECFPLMKLEQFKEGFVFLFFSFLRFPLFSYRFSIFVFSFSLQKKKASPKRQSKKSDSLLPVVVLIVLAAILYALLWN